MAAATITLVPTNEATNVTTLNTVITATFSAAVRHLDDSAIINADLLKIVSLRIKNATGKKVPFAATINAGKTVITVVPTKDLSANTLYYLEVDGTKVENAAQEVSIKTFSTFTTSAAGIPLGTKVERNSIIGKAMVAGDVDGNQFSYLGSDQDTIMVVYNSGGTDRVVTVKSPELLGVTKRIDDINYTLKAGEVGIVNIESQLYSNSKGMVDIDVAHSDIKIAVFYKN